MDENTPSVDAQSTPTPLETEVTAATTESPAVLTTTTTPALGAETSEPTPDVVPEEPQPAATPLPALTLEQMLARLSPTELKALFKKYLFEIGAKGRAKTKAQFAEKEQKIIAHIGIHGRITHKEAMVLTSSAKTTATRLLQGLEKEGKVVQHGGYKARDAYYSLRL